ncbi:hypothetical protein [Bacillus cereus]|uniref:hypothetical protein n=1 Tax=Bacillus cereus TaxID=1396 RepID=UPI000BFAF8AD|nr:hypothetical protein [Bacillus cereus]PFD44779.1 hypothetical protein CN281_19165 [Bacillus cereus]
MTARLYKFTPWLIKLLIPKGYKGSYILYSKNKQTVVPIYVGRSDTDLQRRLLKHPYLNVAHFFEYYIFDSAEKAFLSEAALYHCFQDDLKNVIHPAVPTHSLLKCPFCNKTYVETTNNRINLIS